MVLVGNVFSIIPIRGTASDVVGIDSATKFKNTVNDSRIVTPAKFAPIFRTRDSFFWGKINIFFYILHLPLIKCNFCHEKI